MGSIIYSIYALHGSMELMTIYLIPLLPPSVRYALDNLLTTRYGLSEYLQMLLGPAENPRQCHA